jgi:5-formyltetrahydrofolate cyclo-ligase
VVNPAKDALRRTLRERRRTLDPAIRAAETAATAAALATLVRLRPRLAVYLAAGAELSVDGALAAAWDRQIPLWAPRVVGDGLTWSAITGPADLVAGYRGIREPRADLPAAPLPPECLVLVPGTGYAPAGARLGQGGGYYDRTLAGLDPDSLAIGVGFSCQWLPELHCEPHDQPLDATLIAGRLHPGTGRPRSAR